MAYPYNRERLLRHEVAEAFLGSTVREAKKQRLLSEERHRAMAYAIERM